MIGTNSIESQLSRVPGHWGGQKLAERAPWIADETGGK